MLESHKSTKQEQKRRNAEASHSTQPLHRRFGAKGSARASLYFYNTKKDVDQFITKMKHVIGFLEGSEGGGLNGNDEDIPSLLL